MTDSTTPDLTIPKVTVLNGHTDTETAYVVDDYPYGGLRTKIRFWVETRTHNGQFQGKQRFAAQTLNPKREDEYWNKPRYSTYHDLVTLYLDDNEHVQWHGVGFWPDGPDDFRAHAMGLYEGLTDENRRRYDILLARSRRINPRTWGDWEELVGLLADHIAQTGADPVLVNGTWILGERVYYLSDPAAYIGAARAQLTSR